MRFKICVAEVEIFVLDGVALLAFRVGVLLTLSQELFLLRIGVGFLFGLASVFEGSNRHLFELHVVLC